MTNAQSFRNEFEAIERDNDGFLDNDSLLSLLVVFDSNDCNSRCDEQENNGSHDATEILTFEDGSAVVLANPGQSEFCAFLRADCQV